MLVPDDGRLIAFSHGRRCVEKSSLSLDGARVAIVLRAGVSRLGRFSRAGAAVVAVGGRLIAVGGPLVGVGAGLVALRQLLAVSDGGLIGFGED